MTRRYGSKQPSKASRRAEAMQYLVMAREPDLATLMRYGIGQAEAERLLAEERKRRANGSASIDLQGLFNA